MRQSLLNTTGNVVLVDFLPDHVPLGSPSTTATAPAASAPASDLRPFVDDCLRRGSEGMYAASVEMMELTCSRGG